MTNSIELNFKKPLDKDASIYFRGFQSEERISITVFDIHNNAVRLSYTDINPFIRIKGVINPPDTKVINILQEVTLPWRYIYNVELCQWDNKLLNLQQTNNQYYPSNESPPKGWYLINGVWVFDIQSSSASIEISNSSFKINCVNVKDIETHNRCYIIIKKFMDWYDS